MTGRHDCDERLAPALQLDLNAEAPAGSYVPPGWPDRSGGVDGSRALPAGAAVTALAIGWQLAELATAIADDGQSLSTQLMFSRPLVRTIDHRLRTLGDHIGRAASTATLARLVEDPVPEGGPAADGARRALVWREVLALHAAILRNLDAEVVPGATDLRHAYEVGRALAQSSFVAVVAAPDVQASLYRRLFDAARLLTVAEWLALLRNDLPEHAADAVFHSLRCWCGWVATATDEQLVGSAGALRAQSRLWRDLLLARRSAVSLLGDAASLDGGRVQRLEQIETISLDAAFSGRGGTVVVAAEEAAILRAATVLPPQAVSAGGPAPGRPELCASPGADGNRPRSVLRRWVERTGSWFAVVLLALAITVVLRSFVVQPFSIPSGSMLPTLQVGDRILVDKLPMAVDSIHLGDIIVFRRVPADRVDPQTEDLVKRVVGLPGDTIWSRGDEVILDGRPLAEPWLPQLGSQCAEQQLGIPRQTIPAGHYFVLGDCRLISYDSRFWGTVPASHIVGKVFVVVWRHGHPWFHWF